VRNRLLEQQQQGVAVLLISEDLDELFSLSDRIGVIYEGRLMGIVDARKATREEIGLMMTGKSPH
jgi:general nucleoside transport system ATP-binding protein